MPAPTKISDTQVLDAIQAWSGNVTAAAAQLGVAKENLRKRLIALHVDLSELRLKDSATHGHSRYPSAVALPMATAGATASLRVDPGSATHGHKKEGAIYPSPASRTNLSAVQTSAATAPVEPEPLPIKSEPRRQLPLRLKPALRERLQEAVYQLQAKYRLATNENLVLEQLVEECFDGWLRSKLDPPKPAAKKGRPDPEGGAE